MSIVLKSLVQNVSVKAYLSEWIISWTLLFHKIALLQIIGHLCFDVLLIQEEYDGLFKILSQ